MRIAANLTQNISKTIQFGNVRRGTKRRRALIALTRWTETDAHQAWARTKPFNFEMAAKVGPGSISPCRNSTMPIQGAFDQQWISNPRIAEDTP
jgi:hypothetical protein